ncbi:DEAD/DEAH box helicase [Pseudomaricurvus alcaniphilus]|uniref:DEAD/DEAH box helicase n=1 Tax=Pseudomaricurvus alcaniphilus TaxID=1166482 RepID=UPI00140D50A6|nr:DEAD/DEAH box helicase [Pseudomaricurvus alcaniphilus]NHN37334.1 DEAD/DEAH box helicase [Pseudomaricurvus alcaniphilus]
MSFLAQLRQQQPAGGPSLALCYLLRIDRDQPGASQTLVLSLVLAEVRQGQPLVPGKPYVIQRPHLHTPPPFLNRADIEALQQLVTTDEHWLQHSSGPLPPASSWPHLAGLLDAGRCFMQQTPQHWVALAAAAAQPVELQWRIDSAGSQHLQWRLSGGQQRQPEQASAGGALVTSSTSAEPYYYQAAQRRLGPCQHPYSAAALALAQAWFQPRPAAAVQALQQLRDQWQALQLPLPREVPQRTVAASATPVLRCLPTGADGKLQDTLQLQFRYCSDCYCEVVGSDSAAVTYWDGTHLNLIPRHREQEQTWQQQLQAHLEPFSVASRPLSWQARDGQAWRDLLIEARPALEALGFEFAIAADFRHHYIVPASWQVAVERNSAEQWRLAVQVTTRGESVDLLALLSELDHLGRDGEVSCRLADGRLLLLPADKVNGLMSELGDLIQQGKLQQGRHNSSGYCLPTAQISRLHSLARHLPEDTRWQGDTALLEQAAELHRPPRQLPSGDSGIRAQLRPYQWQGVLWLQHLRQHGANGLLADDMGLGKTLQALTHLCLEQRQGRLAKPALIVAPTSLLHNWAAEIQRFAPHLRQLVIHGPQRHQHWSQLQDFHIVISSYPTVVNDLAQWQQQPLSWVVLDEAQWIKNPRTRASQALRQLHSDQRLCLSGTPLENHLGELWSLLDFLMPGCLGARSDFKRYFQKPIEQEADSDRLQLLLQRIAPFMLRRSKDQVATDLPAKTEIVQTISLADDQQAFYDDLKSDGWRALQERLAETSHAGEQQMLVLTALLTLRQACCDPQLLGEHQVSSSKRQHCMEMIEELVAEQRGILVFSQFTSVLDLLARDLEDRGIDYFMLTGKTRQRQALVDAFQTGAAPVFLISLKAGGVGLNLTRADTVIHYDPWWNSSAEQQASDRAHRIGQDKPVFVYKLIAENTIEEKIAELQQRKALLSQHVNQQAQASAEQFALKLDDLLALFRDEATEPLSTVHPPAE